MRRIRIGYFADGPWSHTTIKSLAADPTIEIAFVVPRTESPDPFLIDYADTHKIPCFPGANINSGAFMDIARSFQCDLFISMSFDQIFKAPMFNEPSLGTLNCHAGKLPFYRGRNVLNWVLINDEKEFGITVHYINEGIDTGDIVLQQVFPITDEDNYETLLHVSYEACAKILYDAVKLVQHGNVTRTPQASIDPKGSRCRKRKTGDEIIEWNQTSRELFNFIRGICYPGPKAHTSLNGNVIKVNNALAIAVNPTGSPMPGEVMGKSERGWIVKTTDAYLEIFDLEAGVPIKIGDRLGT